MFKIFFILLFVGKPVLLLMSARVCLYYKIPFILAIFSPDDGLRNFKTVILVNKTSFPTTFATSYSIFVASSISTLLIVLM